MFLRVTERDMLHEMLSMKQKFILLFGHIFEKMMYPGFLNDSFPGFHIKSFLSKVSISYFLTTPENHWFSVVVR